MAMNEKLCVPLPFTLMNPGSWTGPDNLQNERLGRVALGTSILADMGSALAIDTIALLATNAAFDTTWRIRAYTSSADATNATNHVYDNATRVIWASNEADKRLHRQGVQLIATPVVARYWRIDLGKPIQIGRVVIGRSFTALDTMDIGYSFKVIDLGDKRRASNSLVNTTVRGKALEYSWVWSWMSEAEARGALLDVLAYAGITRDLLCVLNPDAVDLHNVIGYGSLVEEVEGVNVAGGNVDSAYEAKFRLQSRLILNL